MQRRLLLGGLGAAALAPNARAALPVPPGNAIAFQVSRNGSPIGEHRLAFSMSGDTLTVVTTITLKVTLAGLTMFNYGLQATELWQGNIFQSLHSVVNYNGDPCTVHAERVANGYAVVGTNQNNPAKNMNYTAPPDTLPLTYWNKQITQSTLLNIQTAHMYKEHVTSPGWNKVLTANGGSIVAQRYDFAGLVTLSVWYDQNNQWASAVFQKDGTITYQKMT